jgi:UDP-2,4-diacetamido-2,4,6-trideoxy-beta-L-altropyranose hydrolase
MNALLIRADASTAIGTGHVMRCLALAHAWKRVVGGPVTFFTSCDSDALVERVIASGCDVRRVERPYPETGDRERLEEAARSAKDGGARVVVDGYHFDDAFRTALRPHARVLVLDDIAHQPHYDADLLLNQNVAAHRGMYDGRTSARLLLGPRHALLRPEFIRVESGGAAPISTSSQTLPVRVLVTLGGSDPDDITNRVLDALDSVHAALTVRVLVGPSNPHLDALRARAAHRALAVELVVAPDDVAVHMTWADIAVSSAGSTIWELFHLGVPSALVTVADNQGENARAAEAAGAALDVQEGTTADLEDRVHDAVSMLAADHGTRARISAKARELVDGRGAERVAMALSEEI